MGRLDINIARPIQRIVRLYLVEQVNVPSVVVLITDSERRAFVRFTTVHASSLAAKVLSEDRISLLSEVSLGLGGLFEHLRTIILIVDRDQGSLGHLASFFFTEIIFVRLDDLAIGKSLSLFISVVVVLHTDKVLAI